MMMLSKQVSPGRGFPGGCYSPDTLLSLSLSLSACPLTLERREEDERLLFLLC